MRLGIQKVATTAFCGALTAALGVFCVTSATAANKVWGDGSSNWSTANFWIPTGLPASGDTVNITLQNGSTVTYDIVVAESNLSSLTISGGNGQLANTLSMPASNVINVSNNEFIGGFSGSPAGGGTGTITQSNGTNNVTGASGVSIYLGYNTSDTGSYNLSGTGVLSCIMVEAIGRSGTGAFSQSSGANTNGGLSIGLLVNSHGTYTLSGGTLNTFGSETIGTSGIGTFSQSGGTNSVASNLTAQNVNIGGLAGSNGTFNLSGGSTTVGGSVFVGGTVLGAGGTGDLNVSGSGDLSIAGALNIYNTASSGVTLSGGAIHTPALNVNGSPTRFNWTGGTLELTSSVTFDSAAAGTTTSAAFGSSLALGSSQTLIVTGDETLGGTGTFDLTLGSGGSHSVSGGITLSPTGTITQNAGSTLSYSSFTQAGGTVNGTLQNQGAFNYQSGQFNGRLLNQGTVSFGSSFTTGNGIENDTTMTVASGQTLILNGAGLDNQGTFTLAGGTLAVGNMTSSGSFVFDSGTLSATQAGGTISASIISNTPNTTININANNVSLGTAASFTGFNHQGILNVGANTVTLNSAVYARLGVLTSINGGTINAPNGVALATGSNLLGHGAVNAQVTGERGSVIEADGPLSLGDSASPAGFNFAGQLRTKQFAVTLNSSGPATLGSLTTLGAGANPGTLNAPNGFVVDFGDAVTGFGLINSTNALTQRATINGTVQGNSGAQPITLSGYIKGTGTLTNVNVTGTYSPGLSPTIVTTTNLSLASTSTLVMELGSTTPGSGHDRIQDSGLLTLGGTLAVSLINGFTPAAGNSFDILNWGTLSGTFSTINLPTLSGLAWNTSQLYSTGVLSVVAVGLPGDYNNNGAVDAADYVLWRKGGPLTNEVDTPGSVNAADYTAWRARFGNPSGSGSGASANAAVPEPATFLLLMFGVAGWCLRRRRAA